jgi:hypothetical protein
VALTHDQRTLHTRILELNFNNCIKYDAFKHLVRLTSPTEAWAKTLPLSRLLADALPKISDWDHLNVISSLTNNEIDYVAEEVCSALKKVLKERVDQLKSSFKYMVNKQVLEDNTHANSKFLVMKMAAGSIKHFYEGLEGRIGTVPLLCSCFSF